MAEVSRLVLEVDSNGVIKATGTLEEFSQAAEKAKTEASHLEQGSDSLDSIFGKLNMSSLAAAGGVGFLLKSFNSLTSTVVNFGKQAVNAYAGFEKIEAGLAGMAGGAEEGKKMFEELRKFSLETTFGVDTLATATTQLMQTGTAAEDVQERLKMLGDIAGGDTEKFMRLVDVYGKIQTVGKMGGNLQQSLQLMSIPITQELEKMGVAGEKTAENITKAFENMTSAIDPATGKAGMFYDSMNAINETIGGKEGFVSDTFREFLVSFAEASGIADVYKSALDVIYNALQGIVDWLQKINENPVTKMIFQGVLLTLLSGIATFLTVSMVKAIAAVAAGLWKSFAAAMANASAHAILNPALLAGVAAAGIAAAGFIAYAAAQSESAEETENAAESSQQLAYGIEKVTTAIEETAESTETLSKAQQQLLWYSEYVESTESAIAAEQKWADATQKQIDDTIAKYKELADAIDEASEREFKEEFSGSSYMAYFSNDDVYKLQMAQAWAEREGLDFNGDNTETVKAYNKYVGDLLSNYKLIKRETNSTLENEKEQLSILREKLDIQNEYLGKMKEIVDSANEYKDNVEFLDNYNQSHMDKAQKDLEVLEKIDSIAQSTIKMSYVDSATDQIVTTSMKFTDNEENKKKIDEARANWYKDQRKSRGTSSKPQLADWQQVLKQAFGITEKEIAGGALLSGSNAIDAYIKRINKQFENAKDFMEFEPTKNNGFEVLKEQYESMGKAFSAIANSTLWDSSEETVQKLYSLLQERKRQYFDSVDKNFDSFMEQAQLAGERMNIASLVFNEDDDSAYEAVDNYMEGLKEAIRYSQDEVKKLEESKALAEDFGQDFKDAKALEDAYKKLNERVERYNKLKTQKADAEADREIAKLEKEYELYRLTTREMQVQQKIREGMSPEKAEQYVRAEEKITSAKNMQGFRDILLNASQAMEHGGNTGAYYKAISSGILPEDYNEYKILERESQKALAKVNNDLIGQLSVYQSELFDALSEDEVSFGDIAAVFGSVVLGQIASTSNDFKAFSEGMQESGSVLGGIANMVAGAFMTALQNVEGFNEVINPVTTVISGLTEILYPIAEMITALNSVLKAVTKIINALLVMSRPFFNIFIAIMQVIGKFADWLGGLVDRLLSLLGIEERKMAAEEEEAERLERLNEQYGTLMDAMKEQEDYYLSKRKDILAETYSASIGAKSVNDMILTPQGQFSTHPDDYIIATKNPSALGGGGNASVSVVINNTVSDVAEAQVETDTDEEGNERLVVNIVSRVAYNIATGSEGFDAAFDRQSERRGGRYVSV